MNVYEKLNEARLRFQNANVKKSGKNSFAGYTYYELADILPMVNQIAKELKFTCVISFGENSAKLSFIDMEKPEDRIEFSSPMSEASLKGCHAVQNMGAVETYIKRYLYQNCFEIVEADVLDMTMNPNESPNNNPKNHKSEKKGNSELDGLMSTVGKALEDKNVHFDEKQIKYANWCMEHKNIEGLRTIVNALVNKEVS